MQSAKLIPFEETHLPIVLRWVNDSYIQDAIGTIGPVTMTQHRVWYSKLQNDQTRLALIIEDENDIPVGLIGLSGIDLRYRNAELWIYLGEESARGKFVGRTAVKLMCEMAFETLALHRLYVHVFDYNPIAQKFFKSCGMTEEGVLRESAFKHGVFIDKHVLSILDREFKSLKEQ